MVEKQPKARVFFFCKLNICATLYSTGIIKHQQRAIMVISGICVSLDDKLSTSSSGRQLISNDTGLREFMRRRPWLILEVESSILKKN